MHGRTLESDELVLSAWSHIYKLNKGLHESMELTRKQMQEEALMHNNDAGSINQTM